MDNQEDSCRTLRPARPGWFPVVSIAFGDLLGLPWWLRAPSGAQLGGPKRSKTPTRRPKAVQEANLAAESQSKSPTWRSNGLLKTF